MEGYCITLAYSPEAEVGFHITVVEVRVELRIKGCNKGHDNELEGRLESKEVGAKTISEVRSCDAEKHMSSEVEPGQGGSHGCRVRGFRSRRIIIDLLGWRWGDACRRREDFLLGFFERATAACMRHAAGDSTINITETSFFCRRCCCCCACFC